MDHYFSIIQNVLSPSPGQLLSLKRTYLRGSSRAHVAWVTSDPTMKMGTSVSLLGNDNQGGTESGIDNATGGPAEREGGRSDAKAPVRLSTYDLACLLTVDGETGKRTAWHYPANRDENNDPASCRKKCSASSQCFLSSVIPSDRRITAILLDAYDSVSFEKADIPGMMPSVWVSDELGNIYKLQCSGLASSTESISAVDGVDALTPSISSGKKRSRPIDLGNHPERRPRGPRAGAFSRSPLRDDLGPLQTTWESVVPSRSVLTSMAYPPDDGAEGGWVRSLLGVSRGSGGWTGLAWASPGPGTRFLFSAREGFSDLRLVDPTARTVVRTYGTTHAPTGMFVPGGSPADAAGSGANSILANTVLITEGSLATLFDVRCPGVVMNLTTPMFDPSWHEGQPQSASKVGNGGCPQADAGSSPSLVASRLSKATGTIRDACGTANPFEVALCIDRALCVYDFRNFTRHQTSLNVLKYDIASITSLAGGWAVACAGIDAEVRIIPLSSKHTLATDHPTTNKTKGEDTEDSPKGTFRTRLNSATTCETTWQGGWVTSCNHAGGAAVGVSMNSEVFIAQ
ncbi:unnamed protein product [Phytomonas sp. Hart1]|nr:unnamed protein product [Phytomonas sp. Hart1]|eukprot:CCW68824.1 unnamed protein product [Phytomonas sp. isolate Hart1]